MRLLKWLILLISIARIQCTCILYAPKTMFCANEFSFSTVYATTETLLLNGGFIAQSKLYWTFPNLKTVEVIGGYLMKEQCAVLAETKFEVHGCNEGTIYINSCVNAEHSKSHVPIQEA